MLSNSTRLLGLALIGSAMMACSDSGTEPAEPADELPLPSLSGGASERMLLAVRLEPTAGFNARGFVLIGIGRGLITVLVHSRGHPAGRNIPQHIHLNPTCQGASGILLNLDANLTVPGEGPGVGPAYPVANRGGVVNYHASRRLSDLLDAVNNERRKAMQDELDSVEELLAWLDLEDRNAHLHVPDPPFTPVNCGEVVRIH